MTEPSLPPSRFSAGYTVGGGPRATAPAQRDVDRASGDRPSGRINSVALVAFVLTLILGPFVAPVTIPLAVVAQRRIREAGQAGAGLAKATIFVGAAYLALAAVVVVLALWLAVTGSGAIQ